jgi:hypothetical protein
MCARTPGDDGSCKTAEVMERQREYSRAHPHRESKESRQKSNQEYRISSYGLTQEQFDLILTAQNYACAMCHEPFAAGQLIHVDHDHACCRVSVCPSTVSTDPAVKPVMNVDAGIPSAGGGPGGSVALRSGRPSGRGRRPGGYPDLARLLHWAGIWPPQGRRLVRL